MHIFFNPKDQGPVSTLLFPTMFKILYATGQGSGQIFLFPTAQEGMSWSLEVDAIKHSIADTNRRMPQGLDMHRDIIFFKETWGSQYIPNDVRWAVNNIEENTNQALTLWD